MTRTDVINKVIQHINGKKYLEIGVYHGVNLQNVNCEYKVGVDPDTTSAATIFKTSDEFFGTNKEKFDVIFIDGLHHCDQVYQDILNSFNSLNDEGGYIITHDMSPHNEYIQRVPRESIEWTGDCWKAWVTVMKDNPHLNMFVVNTDYGCGIIEKKKNQSIIQSSDCDSYFKKLTYEEFNMNRISMLNLIDPIKFENYIKK